MLQNNIGGASAEFMIADQHPFRESTNSTQVFDRLYSRSKSKRTKENNKSELKSKKHSTASNYQNENNSQFFQSENNQNLNENKQNKNLFIQSNSMICSLLGSPKSSSIAYNGNIGDRMYLQQVTSNHTQRASWNKQWELNASEEREKYLSRMKQQKEQKSFFCQQINQEKGSIKKKEEYLMEAGERYKQQKEMRTYVNEEEQLAGCTFQPQLDQKRIEKYVKNRSKLSTKSVHVNLYNESTQFTQNRKNLIENDIKSIKEKANIMRKQKNKIKSQQISISDLNQRLYSDSIKQKQKVQKENEEKKFSYELIIDKQTGLRRFEPRCYGEQPKSARLSNQDNNQSRVNDQTLGTITTISQRKNQLTTTINDSLYQESKILAQNRTKSREKAFLEQQKQFNSIQKVNSLSIKIVNNKRVERMRELFEMLDNDGDGMISSDKIDLSQISSKLLDIMTPFLVKMEQENKIYQFTQFQSDIMIFFKNASFLEKEELFGPKKKIQDMKKDYSYKPCISERTSRLALKKSQSRGRQPNQDIHNFLCQEAKNTQEQKKLENDMKYMLKNEKENLEYSFKPQVNDVNKILCQKAKERYENGLSRKELVKPMLPSGQLLNQSSIQMLIKDGNLKKQNKKQRL